MAVSQIQQTPIGQLRPHPANAHTHSKKQIALIARSIEQFGFIVPIVVDENGVILAGHGRWLAAKKRGLKFVSAVVASGLSDAEQRAYVLADNRLTEKAGWDRPALAMELQLLAPLLAEAGLDIELTGFETSEIDALMGDLSDPDQDPADEVPEITKNPISRKGDLWLLGPHRLLCGDARQRPDFRKLMGSERASMVFTDPPYNTRIASVQGRGKIKHREFAVASGEMSREKFTKFLSNCLSLAAQHSVDGSIHFVCMDWRHIGEMLAASEEVYTEFKNLIVWAKTNAGQGTFYKSQHELIFAFKNGDSPHINNFELGQHGRNRSNVWTYAGINTFRAGRMEDLRAHPTSKPVGLIADAMRDCSRRGNIVLDCFIGAGTTILAAERVGRCGFGIEIDPRYVDAAICRWQQFTKRDTILEATGQTFNDVAKQRASQRDRRPK